MEMTEEEMLEYKRIDEAEMNDFKRDELHKILEIIEEEKEQNEE